MNVRDLTYLVAVADYQHFGKAAAACFVSQPALSMQLQKLEASLGVQLFERTNKHVMVTDVGKEIIARARSLLLQVDDIKRIAKAHQDPFAGVFRLGVFPTLAPYVLPRCVVPIHKKFPKLKLFLTEEKTDILIERVQKGELDCALLALPIDNDSLISTPLFDDPFMLAVAKTHPLSKRKTVHMEDIARQPLLLLEEGHCLRAQALEVCQIAGSIEQSDFRATSMETLRHMVAAGVGVTLIPKMAMHKNDGIVYIPFKNQPFSRSIGLVWRKNASRNQAVVQIGEVIRQSVG